MERTMINLFKNLMKNGEFQDKVGPKKIRNEQKF
jgi:hypothetical protein